MATNFKSPGSIEEAMARIRATYGAAGDIVTSEYFPHPKPETVEDPGVLSKILSGAGAALGAAKTYGVDLPVNYFSTTPLRKRAEKFWETGEEQYRPVPAEELAKDAYVGRPEAGEPAVVQHAKGATRGAVGRYIGVTTDPTNIALMVGGGLAARAGGALVGKAMHLGFSAMMAKATYDAADKTYTEYRKEGWTPAVSEHATETAIDAGLTVAPFLGRRGPKPGPDPGSALALRGKVYEGEVVDYSIPNVDYSWVRGRRRIGPGGEPGEAGGAAPSGARPRPPGPGAPPAPPPPAGPTKSAILQALRAIDRQIVEVYAGVEKSWGTDAQAQARRAELLETRKALEKMYRDAPGDPDIVAPAPAPPPPAPASDVAPAPSRTAYEKPTVSQMSKGAVNSLIAGLDARIMEASALNLPNEVAELTRLRQSLSEAYSVKNQPPSMERSPEQAPGMQSQLELLGLQASLKQQADSARARGDNARAAQMDAVASSIESQLRQPGQIKGPAPLPAMEPAPQAAPGAAGGGAEPPAGPTSDVRVGGPTGPVVGPGGPPTGPEAATAAAGAATAESVRAAGDVGEDLFPGTGPSGNAGPLAEVIGGTPAAGAASRLRRPQFVDEAAGVVAPPDTSPLGYPPGVRAVGLPEAPPAALPQPVPGVPDTGVLTDEQAAAIVEAASAPQEGYYDNPPPSIVMMDDAEREAYLEAVDGLLEDPDIDTPEKLSLASEESGLPMDDEEAAWHLARAGRGEPAGQAPPGPTPQLPPPDLPGYTSALPSFVTAGLTPDVPDVLAEPGGAYITDRERAPIPMAPELAATLTEVREGLRGLKGMPTGLKGVPGGYYGGIAKEIDSLARSVNHGGGPSVFSVWWLEDVTEGIPGAAEWIEKLKAAHPNLAKRPEKDPAFPEAVRWMQIKEWLSGTTPEGVKFRERLRSYKRKASRSIRYVRKDGKLHGIPVTEEEHRAAQDAFDRQLDKAKERLPQVPEVLARVDEYKEMYRNAPPAAQYDEPTVDGLRFDEWLEDVHGLKRNVLGYHARDGVEITSDERAELHEQFLDLAETEPAPTEVPPEPTPDVPDVLSVPPVRGDVSKGGPAGWRVRTYDPSGNIVTETPFKTKKEAKQFLSVIQPELKRNRAKAHAVTLESWEKNLVEFDPDSDPNNIPAPFGPLELETAIDLAQMGKAGSVLKSLRRAKQIGGADIHPNWIRHFPFIDGLETTGTATPWRPNEIPQALGPYIPGVERERLLSAAVQGPGGPPMVFLSGMSRTKDLLKAATAEKPLGVDIGQLSGPGITQLARAIVQQDAKVFVDSGAFSLFKRNIRKSLPMLGEEPVEALDFDTVFERYDALLDAMNEANPNEEARSVWLSMPDVVGDQAASLQALEDNAAKIRRMVADRRVRTIFPLQKSPGGIDLIAHANRVIAVADRKPVILGIPSNAAAASLEDITKVAKEVDYLNLGDVISWHILGSGTGKKLDERVAAIRAVLPQAIITADANRLRGVLNGDVTRSKAMEEILGMDVGEPTELEPTEAYDDTEVPDPEDFPSPLHHRIWNLHWDRPGASQPSSGLSKEAYAEAVKDHNADARELSKLLGVPLSSDKGIYALAMDYYDSVKEGGPGAVSPKLKKLIAAAQQEPGLEVAEEDTTVAEPEATTEEVTVDELPALAEMLRGEGFLDEIPNPTTSDVLDALKAHGINAYYPDAEIVQNILKGAPDVIATEENAPVGGKPPGPAVEPLPEELPAAGEEAGVGGETPSVPGELEGAVVDSPGTGDAGGTGVQPSGGASQPDGVPAGAGPALAPAPEGSLHGDIPPGVPSTPAVTPKPEHPDYSPKDAADPFFENRSWNQKVTDNVTAIRLLKELEANQRVPTPEEQETLAKFVGWGGMPRLFDPYARGAESSEAIDKTAIETARAEIQEMLTEAEFSGAQMSTPNAHYTGAGVVRAMWDVLETLGVSPGQRVLEPSMGTGNFFAMAPDGLLKTGVELDSLTARIAKKLHPNATVIMSGLEQTDLPDNFYDVVIGNPPFGKIKVFDPAYKSDKVVTESIHNYMLVKGLDKLRPGGVLMIVTSRYTMDAKDPAIRERVAERAKLLGAVRLPSSTFQKNANTSVITDVLLFQKYKPGETREREPDWLKTEENQHEEPAYYGGPKTEDLEGRPVWRNVVWDTKRGRVLGTEGRGRGMYGSSDYMVTGDAPTRAKLAEAFRNLLPEGMPLRDLTQEERFTRLERKPFDPEQMRGIKPGNFVIDEDGKIWQALTGELEEWDPPESANPDLKDTPRAKKMAEGKLKGLKEKIKDYLPMRDATKALLAGQVDPSVTDAEFKVLQKAAEKEYDAFVKKHGPLHARPNPSQLAEDPDFPNVLALEKDFAPEQKVGKKVTRKAAATKADIFTKRLIPRREKVVSAESPAAAYAVALSESGRLDFDRMAELTGQTKEALQEELESEGIIYHDPQAGAFAPADSYLAGNVRKKLIAAEAAAADDSRYKGNVEALRAVVPPEKLPEQINAALGSPWISGTYVEEFISHLAGLEPGHYLLERLKAHYIESIATWRITYLKTVLGDNTTAGTATWGTEYYPAASAIDDILNLRDPQIWSQDPDGNRYLDIEKTENAKEIKLKVEQEWRDWLWSDEKRSKELSKIFNENFYGTVPRRFDGKHLTFPGMNRAGLRNGDLDQHQKDGVWQMLQSPNTLIALPVGAGKTFTAIAAAMEARRMGIARKPLFAVPSSVLPQWIRAFKQLYPHANVLAVDPQDMSAKSRGRVMSRIATGDWDAVVVTHEGLERLPLAKATVERMIGEELKILDRAFLDILRDKSLSFTEAMDAEIQDFIEATIAYQKKLFDLKRDRRYRKDKKAKFIPWMSSTGESSMVDLKTYTKVAKPKTPTFNEKGGSREALKGLEKQQARLVKELAKAKLNLKTRILKFLDPSRKDKGISFDELGIDWIVVDESHKYKRLYFTTKMQRLSGLSTDSSNRSYDLYMKGRLIQERNNGAGLHFLTGTPLTNTIAEMYNLMRYLSPDFLRENGLEHFDAWAKVYATTKTGIEVDPTGSRMRTQKRFNKFVNLGSLLRGFRDFTLYRTPDELGIPRPELAKNTEGARKAQVVIVPKPPQLEAYVKFLVRRAERLRNNKDIDPTDDNPLLITMDGMKAALDMRLVDPDAPDHPGSKLNQGTEKVYRIWKETQEDRKTQMIFLDLGTPSADAKATMAVYERDESGARKEKRDVPKLNLYADIKKKLVGMGVPEGEIEFIHDWGVDKGGLKAEERLAELFHRMNTGETRILLASSGKGGVGVNVQQKMIALHHFDVPYTPDWIEQRNGRIQRQGNENPEVQIYEWVAKGTFDIYKWQLVGQKSQFINSALSGSLEADEVEDLSFVGLSAEEVIALGSDNPLIRERMVKQKELERIERLAHAFAQQKSKLAQQIGRAEHVVDLDRKAQAHLSRISGARTEDLIYKDLEGKEHTGKRTDVAQAMLKTAGEQHKLLTIGQDATIGSFRGIPVHIYSVGEGSFSTQVGFVKGGGGRIEVGATSIKPEGKELDSWIASIEAQMGKTMLETKLRQATDTLATHEKQLAKIREKTEERFPHSQRELELRRELQDIEAALGLGKDDAGTTALGETEGFEGPAEGGGEGGDPPPRGPRIGGDFDDPPDDPRYEGGDGAGEAPEGRPDQGAQPGDPGWDNRVRGARDRTRRRGKGGTANMGVDPQAFWDAVILGVEAMRKGARTFGRWVASLVADLGGNPGENILRRLWRAAKEWFAPRPANEGPRVREAADAAEGFGQRRQPQGEPTPRPTSKETRRAAEEAARDDYEPPRPRGSGKPSDFDINLEWIKTEGNIRELEARIVEHLKRVMTNARSYHSWAEARRKAVLAGLDERDFNRILREKGAVTDWEIEAGRMLREKAATDMAAKMSRWKDLEARAKEATGDTRQTLIEEALEAKRDYISSVGKFAGIAADTVRAGSEAGRALAMHRKFAEGLTPEEKFIKRLLRGLPTPDDKLVAALAKALAEGDHRAIMAASRKILNPGTLPMVVEFFINSVLSGPATLGANVLGNFTHEAVLRTPERGIAAQLEERGFRQWVERLLAGTETPQERVSGEALQALKAQWKLKFGFMEGLKAMWHATWNEGIDFQGTKGEYHMPAIPGVIGKITRTPGRWMEALDIGAKAAAAAAERASGVFREPILEGRRKGWSEAQVRERMTELDQQLRRYEEIEALREVNPKALKQSDYNYLAKHAKGPVGKIHRAKRFAANESTFRDEVMQLTKYLQLARTQYPWLAFAVPFIKTPERILVQGFRRTPIGLAKTLVNIRQGKLKGGEASDRLAQGILGTIVTSGLYMLAKDGLLTGGGPADPKERSILMKTGWKPYAVNIGGTHVSLQRIEPIATQLGLAADLAEALDQKTAGDIWDKLHYSVINNVANKTYLEGMVSTAEAFGDPKRYGAQLQKRLLGSMVPNLLASAARAIDPTVRQTDDISSTLLARVPWLSKTLPAKVTGTGEPIDRGEDPLSRFASPFRYAVEAGPERNLERLFLETGYIPSAPPRHMTLPGTRGKKIQLTDEERQVYASYAKRATAFARNLAANGDWSRLDVYAKEELIKRIYRFAHDAARRDLYGRLYRRIQTGEYELKV